MALGVYISSEITSFAGLTLEKYFIRKLIESIAEVKRQRKNFKPEDFSRKIEILKSKILSGYEIESVCYTLDEM